MSGAGSPLLTVPVVLWGRRAPTHCISALVMTPDMRHIVTGSNDGQIILWDVGANAQVAARSVLLGHTAAITCLALTSTTTGGGATAGTTGHCVVSAADNGELTLWDLSDGRCIEHTKTQYVHTHMQAYQMLASRDVRLVCNGFYAEILVLHPLSLATLFSLSSRNAPDWISALCVLRPVKREENDAENPAFPSKKEDDVVVAISNSGTVKVWTLSGNEEKTSQPIYEDESKHIRCLNVQTLRCCAYNQRTVLIVCSKYWQIYDAGDFTLLCSESSPVGERWAGGEFVSVDRVCVWTNEGKGYLYKLPTNVNPDHEHYRKAGNPHSPRQVGPQAYSVLTCYTEKPLECTPAMTYFHGRRDRESKLLLRGDSEGRIVIWLVPDVQDGRMKLVRQESFDKLPAVGPRCMTSLAEQWSQMSPRPEGIIDQLNHCEADAGGRDLDITASIYLASQGRLVLGRDDGSIVIVPAVEAVILQLLDNGRPKDSLARRVLRGHTGRVNCLLYPHADAPRYDPTHLLSGGVDFTVCLWDISSGERLHVYSVHGGEITQLLTPPDNCNPRVLSCVASVASDHSLALLSLAAAPTRRCLLLASRQLFPIQTVKWRPLDDFLVIGCTDGTVYVWQMETGHLDRVVHGVTAEDIMCACDSEERGGETTTHLAALTNPTISLTQAFRRHNIATFKNFAQQTIQKAQEVLSAGEQHGHPAHHPSLVHRPHAAPMLVQGLRTNIKDPDAHIVYFDTEALIVSLLREEYSAMSPGTLESLGFFVAQATDQNLSDTQKKMADLLSKAKTNLEVVGQRIQAEAEKAGLGPPVSPSMGRRGEASPRGGASPVPGGRPPRPPARPHPPHPTHLNLAKPPSAPSLVLEIAQVLMSVLHAWGLDINLDKVCRAKLGMLPPKQPVTFGMLSRAGHMSLLLPGWYRRLAPGSGTNGHWQLSSPLTTQHLLSTIATANTLMSMTHATFRPGDNMYTAAREPGVVAEPDPTAQAQTKQGWSLLATLHCVLLPELIGRQQYRPPRLDMLARRWQDRCLEVRDAAQALLLAELRRIGAAGRKLVVQQWAPFLPSYVDPAVSLITTSSTATTQQPQQQQQQQQGPPGEQPLQGGGQTMMEQPGGYSPDYMEDDDADAILGDAGQKVSESFESRRKQATAIVLMGVMGAEFGAEMSGDGRHGNGTHQGAGSRGVNGDTAEGFGIAQYSNAMHTSRALTFLLLHPSSARLPAHTPLRRAAVDLLGRGFTVWEPYLDVSAVLLGLLELCVDGDRLVPSMTFGLPLCPPADACRTARHALSLIATARPPAFIITMAKEVARYNALSGNSSQSAAAQQIIATSPLTRAKPEILRVIELLIEKIPNEVVDLLPEVMDVVVHCIDSAAFRSGGLPVVFPAITKYNMLSACKENRKICVGARNGSLAFHDLKTGKCQVLPAHSSSVTAVCFSPDAKALASYSYVDQRLLFWQTGSTSLFNLGAHQTKCVKSFATPPFSPPPNIIPYKSAKLMWLDARVVVLLTADGVETRYRL